MFQTLFIKLPEKFCGIKRPLKCISLFLPIQTRNCLGIFFFSSLNLCVNMPVQEMKFQRKFPWVSLRGLSAEVYALYCLIAKGYVTVLSLLSLLSSHSVGYL